MNVKNNKRRKESITKIEKSFVNMLQTKELNQISVTDICKNTGLNRSTFYANFVDIYDLADKLGKKLEQDFGEHFSTTADRTALTMFRHIYENQLFYKTYFKLGYQERHKHFAFDVDGSQYNFDKKYIKYHVEFFRNGLNAIIKMWLDGGCCETPEEMAEIIKSEYTRN